MPVDTRKMTVHLFLHMKLQYFTTHLGVLLQKVKAVDFNKSPVWGSRKPRRQSMRAPAVNGVGFLGNDEDAEDAEGVAALMSLATGEPHPPAGRPFEVQDPQTHLPCKQCILHQSISAQFI